MSKCFDLYMLKIYLHLIDLSFEHSCNTSIARMVPGGSSSRANQVSQMQKENIQSCLRNQWEGEKKGRGGCQTGLGVIYILGHLLLVGPTSHYHPWESERRNNRGLNFERICKELEV